MARSASHSVEDVMQSEMLFVTEDGVHLLR